MNIKDLPIALRQAHQGDVPFIFNSWLKSYRNSKFSKNIPTSVYFSEHHKVLEEIALNDQIYVACNTEDESQIFGYVAATEIDGIFLLHYVYVKQPYRKIGLAKFMVESVRKKLDDLAFCTHLSNTMEKTAEKYNLIYSPYLALKSSTYEGDKDTLLHSKDLSRSDD